MKLHEYQAKKLLGLYGVNIVPGGIAYTPNEAYDVANSLGKTDFFVKAQSNIADSSAIFLSANKIEEIPQTVSAYSYKDVVSWANFMIGNTLFSKDGEQEVRKIYIEKAYKIKKSMYLSLMIDTKSQSLILASAFDKKKKTLIFEKIPLATRPKLDSFKKIFSGLNLDESNVVLGKNLFKSLYKAFIALDVLKIEIPELILTSDNELLVKEVEVIFDESALSRQPEVSKMIDLSELTKEQEFAYKWNIRYKPFAGNISIMTNGVGLGLALADMIKIGGGEISHLIDIGWNANRTRIVKAFQLILSSINVDGLLIYVYGGSLHCDEVAEGIVAAVKEMALEIPLVVRLGGTNEDIAKNILERSGLPITIAEDMANATELIIKSTENKDEN